jgi:hypothetical protein
VQTSEPSSERSSNCESEDENGPDADYIVPDEAMKRNPYYPNQEDLNDLIRDLGLTKSKAELLTSRLKQWNLLEDSVQVTNQRKRHQSFSIYFRLQEGLCFCHDVTGLFEACPV